MKTQSDDNPLGLKFTSKREIDPTPLIDFLRGKGWVHEKDIKLGDDRQIRLLAAAAPRRIVSGNKGYCLIEEVTLKDIQESSSRLISMGQKSIDRGFQLIKAYHEFQSTRNPI